jgi:hypothetical protein
MKIHISSLLITLTLLIGIHQLFAQGTAFTYQGRLNNGGSMANGSFDLAFTLYATNITGSAIVGPVTNSAVSVTNGLFTTPVDFGNVFNGTSNWLQIAVSTNGANSFTILAPRQQLTPAPYAVYSANAGSAITATTAASANSVLATNISGTIPLTHLPAQVVTNGNGGVTLSGNFSGSGAGLTLGQSASTVYGTAQLTLTSVAGLTLIPGLTQTINVPTNATVYISTSGGVETTSDVANGYSVVDIAIGIDGTFPANGGYQRLYILNNTEVGFVDQNWSFSLSTTLPGAHTISIYARGAGIAGSSTAYVSGGTGTILQGQLTSLILKQ